MNANDPKTSWWRFSLREMLILLAFVAVGFAALKNAGFVWQLILSTAGLLLFLTTSIVALIDRGKRQVASIGIVAGILIYIASVSALESHVFRAPTSQMLRSLHGAVARVSWVDSSGNVIEGYDPNVPSSTVGRVGAVVEPDSETFMATGHLLCMLVFAWFGRQIAFWSYYRRLDETAAAG